jgi:predicted  nucleic acid-binding Zn-ribbon protein
MTITSSTAANTLASGSGSGTANVAQLQKQIQNLQQQIQKENQSKDSAKVKEQTVQALQLEIQALQLEIQQAETKATKTSAHGKNSTEEKATVATDVSDAGGVSQSSSDHILDVSA